MSGQHLLHYLGHAKQGAGLQTFAQARHRYPRPDMIGRCTENLAEVRRRNADDEQIALADGLLQIGGRTKPSRTRKARKSPLMSVCLVDLHHVFASSRP
jgi:hypothetical protein